MRVHDGAVLLAALEVVVDEDVVVAGHDVRRVPAGHTSRTPLQAVVGRALADRSAAAAVVVVVRGLEVEGEGLAARVSADTTREVRDREGRVVRGRRAGHHGHTGGGEPREGHRDGRNGG